MMKLGILQKAIRYQYPQELANGLIELGFEPAFTMELDTNTGKYRGVPTGIPENSPDHARIATWPKDLPRPTVGDLEQWAAAYDEQQTQLETARAAREAAQERLKAFVGKDIAAGDVRGILADILTVLYSD